MTPAGSQAATQLAKIRKCVAGIWLLFNYKWCPRDLTQNALGLLNRKLVSYLEEIDQSPALQMLLPFYNELQDAFLKTIGQVDRAAVSFEYTAFLERRETFYQAYREIFKYITHVKEFIGAPDLSADEHFSSSSPSAPEWQADAVLAQISVSVTRIWRAFRYEPDRLHGLPQKSLLGFEKELRDNLERIVTSQDLRDLLWKADEVQDELRETVLQLNFAADILTLPLTPERSSLFGKTYETTCDCLSQVRSNLRSRA